MWVPKIMQKIVCCIRLCMHGSSCMYITGARPILGVFDHVSQQECNRKSIQHTMSYAVVVIFLDLRSQLQ